MNRENHNHSLAELPFSFLRTLRILNKHWLPRNTRHLKQKSNIKDKAQSQQTEKGNLEKREYSEKKHTNNFLRQKRYYIHETKEYYHLNFFRKKKYLEIIHINSRNKTLVEELEDKVEKNLPESRGKRKK